MVAAPTDSPRAKEFRSGRRRLLPTGTYLARISIDRGRKSEKDPAYEVTASDFVAQVEISGEWKPGYQPPKIVKFPPVRD